MKYLSKRMIITCSIALAYMLVLIFFGSPLLALTTWLGWVKPQ